VLRANQQIESGSRCSHPAAFISLPTGDSIPVFRAQYPVARHLRPMVTEKVNEWYAKGVTTLSPHNNAWNSSIIIARKKDAQGNWCKYRICIDPRHVNALLPECNLPIPIFSELFRKLEGFKIASALDLESSYHQFTVEELDRMKTACTWDGLLLKLNLLLSPFFSLVDLFPT